MKKFFLSAAAVALCTTAYAESELVWHLVTPDDVRMPVSNVRYLLSTDDDSTFAIVCRDGSSVDGVESMTFEKSPSSDVGESVIGGTTVKYVSNGMTVFGAAGENITIVGADGAVVLSRTVYSDDETVDVSTLPQGIYVLCVGNTNLKFIKR